MRMSGQGLISLHQLLHHLPEGLALSSLSLHDLIPVVIIR